MVACAQRVFGWVEQGQDAGFLVVVHAVVPQERQGGHKGNNSGKNDFPGQSGKKDDKNARSHNQRGRTEVGLLQNQGDRNKNQHEGDNIMYPFQTAFIALEIPRDSHGNTDFHDFGRLDTGKT